MKLYNYFRSSASYRVRIALHWKNIPFEYIPIHLVKDGGRQRSEEFRRINPMAHVPALDHDGFVVAESMAILQYLDDLHPENRLIPTDPRGKARVLQLCEIVNSGIQPLQNLKVQKLLESEYHLSKPDSDRFVKHWIQDGFTNLERLLSTTAGEYSYGNLFTAADCFVVPQCLTAKRFGVEVTNFPILARVNANALKLEAVQKSLPEKQPDYQS